MVDGIQFLKNIVFPEKYNMEEMCKILLWYCSGVTSYILYFYNKILILLEYV